MPNLTLKPKRKAQVPFVKVSVWPKTPQVSSKYAVAISVGDAVAVGEQVLEVDEGHGVLHLVHR